MFTFSCFHFLHKFSIPSTFMPSPPYSKRNEFQHFWILARTGPRNPTKSLFSTRKQHKPRKRAYLFCFPFRVVHTTRGTKNSTAMGMKTTTFCVRSFNKIVIVTKSDFSFGSLWMANIRSYWFWWGTWIVDMIKYVCLCRNLLHTPQQWSCLLLRKRFQTMDYCVEYFRILL